MNEDEARSVVADRFGGAAVDRLTRFVDLLTTENATQNLIAPSTLPHIWVRHVLDSLQLCTVAPPGRWLDIGTGGGFPGLAIAIAEPRTMLLTEPRRRRADFLARCVEFFGLQQQVAVLATKVDRVAFDADVISARAVADIGTLLTWADHCSRATTRWLLPRGKVDYSALDTAKGKWRFMFHVEHSITDPGSRILVLDGVARR